MKARLLIEVGDYERYVIARYFAVAAPDAKGKKRTRATRQQVIKFVHGALKMAVTEQREALRGRQRAHARKLAESPSPTTKHDDLARPAEQQPSLAW